MAALPPSHQITAPRPDTELACAANPDADICGVEDVEGLIELEASGVDDDGGEVAEDEEVEEFELPPVRVYFDDAKKKRKGAKKRD